MFSGQTFTTCLALADTPSAATALTLTWYDGGLKPPRPKELEPDRRLGGPLYIGEKGKLMGHRLIPESSMQSYGQPPKTLAPPVMTSDAPYARHRTEVAQACAMFGPVTSVMPMSAPIQGPP